MSTKITTIILSALMLLGVFTQTQAQSVNDYNLIAPDGWASEAGIAEKQGLKYAFLPKDQSWENSDVLLFSNQAQLKKHESIFDYIDDDILFYAASVNDLVVKRGKVIEIGEGHNLAVVKHMFSENNGVYEAYAYIPEEGKVNFVTLRATSEEVFNQNLGKFKELVTSYRLAEPAPGMMVDSE